MKNNGKNIIISINKRYFGKKCLFCGIIDIEISRFGVNFMKIEMGKVFERDIGLLMINKFCNNRHIVDYFCSKVVINNYQLEIAQHSVIDENGESDITLILSK